MWAGSTSPRFRRARSATRRDCAAPSVRWTMLSTARRCSRPRTFDPRASRTAGGRRVRLPPSRCRRPVELHRTSSASVDPSPARPGDHPTTPRPCRGRRCTIMSSATIAPRSRALAAGGSVRVEIVSWPDERARDDELARAGRLRLLLVEESAVPPSHWDPTMDWIRLPATDDDICSRVRALQHRAEGSHQPRLDDFGVLWRNGAWVSLAPMEAQLLAVLLDSPGRVCGRTRLAKAWPDGPVTDHAVNTNMARLRRKIAPLDLTIHTVRRRGYFLEIGS